MRTPHSEASNLFLDCEWCFPTPGMKKCIHNLSNAGGFIHGFNVTVALLFEKILKKKILF